MQYEVEQKYVVTDSHSLLAKLGVLGTELGEPTEQVDTYFASPSRDFGKTDEALRLRRDGGNAWITYKGPKIDKETKTRREIELQFIKGESHERAEELLEALGYKKVRDVKKTRRRGVAVFEGNEVDVVLDVVAGLGEYLELEITVEEAGVDEAKKAIASLAEHLELTKVERRSYLEMLLGK